MKRIVSTIVLAAAFDALACAGPVLPTIQTLPASGDVAGPPGTAVGWGFTLSYLGPADWVVLNDSNFTGSTVFGSYLDYLTLPTAPFYVVGPAPESASITQPWDLSATLGLGEFDINSTVPPGTVIPGDIAVDYSLFSQDPNDPAFDAGSFVSAGTLDAPVEIMVAPEPGSMLFIGMALLSFVLAIRRRGPLLTKINDQN
jgi:hypothetical protein